MKKFNILFVLFLGYLLLAFSFKNADPDEFLKSLRTQYEKDPSEWPAPEIDSGIVWKELAAMDYPPAPIKDSILLKKIQLGKILFFDPRLSTSGQISCSSCHDPS